MCELELWEMCAQVCGGEMGERRNVRVCKEAVNWSRCVRNSFYDSYSVAV